MSTVKEIQAAIPALSREEIQKVRDWIDEHLEDQLELTDEVKAKLDQCRQEIAAGRDSAARPDGKIHELQNHSFAINFLHEPR